MSPLKLLGLSILAGTCMIALIAGYKYFREQRTADEIRQEGLEIHNEVNHVIVTGEERMVTVDIPEGYRIVFDNDRLKIGDFCFPEEGRYSVNLEEKEISDGKHRLKLFFKNDQLAIREVGQ